MDQQAAKVTEFTIDRSKWHRGQGSLGSRLLVPETGKMCCLGFYALACGMKPEDIHDRGAPDNYDIMPLWHNSGTAPWLYNKPERVGGHIATTQRSTDCARLMRDNDDRVSESYTEEDREQEITAIFANNGVTVHFIDGPIHEPEAATTET